MIGWNHSSALWPFALLQSGHRLLEESQQSMRVPAPHTHWLLSTDLVCGKCRSRMLGRRARWRSNSMKDKEKDKGFISRFLLRLMPSILSDCVLRAARNATSRGIIAGGDDGVDRGSAADNQRAHAGTSSRSGRQRKGLARKRRSARRSSGHGKYTAPAMAAGARRAGHPA